MTTAQKIATIRETMSSMPVGNCGVKWDRMVWRVSENGWIVGEIGVRRDAHVHSLESVVEWFCFARGIQLESYENLFAKVA